VTNGEPIVVRAAMKPLPTLMRPLPTVDMRTGDAAPALLERSDVCAVPAARVVIEAMICLVIADALLEKLGGDSLDEVRRHFQASFSGEA
jgi:chorismate synthase